MVSKYRVWIFRILTIIATGLMLVSWILPWWKCHIMEVNSWMIIRPWALQTTLGEQFSSYIAGSAMPAFFCSCYVDLSINMRLIITDQYVCKKQASKPMEGKNKLATNDDRIRGIIIYRSCYFNDRSCCNTNW